MFDPNQAEDRNAAATPEHPPVDGDATDRADAPSNGSVALPESVVTASTPMVEYPMIRFCANPTWFALLAFVMVALASPSAEAAVACGLIDGRTLEQCTVVNTKTECTEKCEPVNMVKVCSTKCDVGCTKTATTSCKGGCETECIKQCTPDPTKYDCKVACTDTCSAKVMIHCKTSIDEAKCIVKAKASCSQTCEEKCKPLPATETCVNKCGTSCNASCTVEENTTCNVDCETSCTTQVKGACVSKCSTTQGALFCNGQYIDGGADLTGCITEIEGAGKKVAGWVKVSGQGDVTVTKGGDSMCSTSRTPGSYWGAAMIGAFVALGAVRRRRVKA